MARKRSKNKHRPVPQATVKVQVMGETGVTMEGPDISIQKRWIDLLQKWQIITTRPQDGTAIKNSIQVEMEHAEVLMEHAEVLRVQILSTSDPTKPQVFCESNLKLYPDYKSPDMSFSEGFPELQALLSIGYSLKNAPAMYQEQAYSRIRTQLGNQHFGQEIARTNEFLRQVVEVLSEIDRADDPSTLRGTIADLLYTLGVWNDTWLEQTGQSKLEHGDK